MSSSIDGMALGVAGDPDLGERASHRAEVLEHGQRSGVLTGRRVRRRRPGQKTLVDAGGLQPRHDLGELALAADHPRSQVRNDAVAVPDQPLGQREGGVDALGGAGRHGDGESRGTFSTTAASIFAVGSTS